MSGVVRQGEAAATVVRAVVDEMRAREVDVPESLTVGCMATVRRIVLDEGPDWKFPRGAAVRVGLLPAVFDCPVDDERVAVFLTLLGKISRAVVSSDAVVAR